MQVVQGRSGHHVSTKNNEVGVFDNRHTAAAASRAGAQSSFLHALVLQKRQQKIQAHSKGTGWDELKEGMNEVNANSGLEIKHTDKNCWCLWHFALWTQHREMAKQLGDF